MNLPTIFDAGEDSTFETPPFQVLGLSVTVTATARWEWTFDDGVTRSFTVPGGQYPDDSVSWTYATPGARHVSVTTYWDGQFTVAGKRPVRRPGSGHHQNCRSDGRPGPRGQVPPCRWMTDSR